MPKKKTKLSELTKELIEDKVISMYGKGMSQRDISEHIEELYC